jgi:hypothetical protein
MTTQIVYNAKTGTTSIVDLTSEEVESRKLTDEQAWISLRLTRNFKLAETDWWASSDLTMSDAQKDYRKALRDLPANTSDPKSPTWPSKP